MVLSSNKTLIITALLDAPLKGSQIKRMLRLTSQELSKEVEEMSREGVILSINESYHLAFHKHATKEYLELINNDKLKLPRHSILAKEFSKLKRYAHSCFFMPKTALSVIVIAEKEHHPKLKRLLDEMQLLSKELFHYDIHTPLTFKESRTALSEAVVAFGLKELCMIKADHH